MLKQLLEGIGFLLIAAFMTLITFLTLNASSYGLGMALVFVVSGGICCGCFLVLAIGRFIEAARTFKDNRRAN